MFEIVEDHRALADPDRMRQPAARRFVAHVRTVGKIVRTELAHEDRIEERRLVRGAPRGVEFGFVRTLQPARSEEHTSELQSLMRISYAVFCLKKKITIR